MPEQVNGERKTETLRIKGAVRSTLLCSASSAQATCSI